MSCPAHVGDKGFETKVSKNKQANRDFPKRESAVSSTYQHSHMADRIYQEGSRHEPAIPSKVSSKTSTLEERARKISERYGVVMEPSDLPNTASAEMAVLRVDKSIRMRVRRVCHECNTAFTAKNECAKCHHTRCDECPRSPAKESEAEPLTHVEGMDEAVAKADRESSAILADLLWGDKQVELRRPSKTGGQDLVHRKPRQRVRRTCHECESLFAPGSKQCGCCGHARCTDCPRDPPKRDKYPFGYPGDVFGPGTDARFECLSCETLYPPEAEDGTSCQRCGLEKSGESPRTVPRRVQPIPDRDVLAKLQATLAGLVSQSFSSSSSSA